MKKIIILPKPYNILCLIIVIMIFSGPLLGGQLKGRASESMLKFYDPTKPLKVIPYYPAVGSNLAASLKLVGIAVVHSPLASYIATIEFEENKNIKAVSVKKGDYVRGLKVLDIGKTAIKLDTEAGHITLSLQRPTNKLRQ